MSEIYDYSGSDGENYISCQDGYVTKNPGWEIEFEFKEKLNPSIIDLINSQISLERIFDRYYSVDFEIGYSPSGWTHKCRCPFPDHNDSSPSFGYNPKDNKFFCFGCSRGGQAVQFVAGMDGLSFFDAARKLMRLEKIENIDKFKKKTYSKEINQLLLNFSSKIRLFLKNNKDQNSLDFAESLCWGLDVYLHKHVPRDTLDYNKLTARIELLLRKLDFHV